MAANNEEFTKLMRKSTRDVHSISDALINAKLACALSDDAVWAEGLLIFYEVFKFLEQAIRNTKNEHLKKFNLPELMRTAAFEKDLQFYLGEDWNKEYIPRKSVRRYLNYLGKLERNEPELLIAYVYHLYMGLLSGGQILTKKRALEKSCKFGGEGGSVAVTEFPLPILEIKKKIRAITNSVCAKLNTDMREKIIKEGRMVFSLNNEIVRTVQGTNKVLIKKALIVLVTSLIAFYAIIYYLGID